MQSKVAEITLQCKVKIVGQLETKRNSTFKVQNASIRMNDLPRCGTGFVMLDEQKK